MSLRIEEDFSTIHRLEKGEYLLTDPRLLRNMVLDKHIKIGGANFLTKGTPLTSEILDRLQEHGIEAVFACHQVQETIEKAAEEVSDVFAKARSVVFKEGVKSALDAVEAFKKGERLHLPPFKEDVLGLVEKILDQFSEYAAEGVRELQRHDQNTTLHSVEVSMLSLEIATALGWNRERVIQTGMAGMLHDVGKAAVPLEILNFPGRLDDEQWKEMEKHALLGYMLLSHGEKVHDLSAFCAGAHHEHFTGEGAGYGVLTSPWSLSMNMETEYTREDGFVSQVISICDVHSALGEARPYKPARLPLEVVMIMNLEARHGKFNPAFYRVWYDIYRKKYPTILQKGHCFPLPSLTRRKLAQRSKNRLILPVGEAKLTHDELAKLGLINRVVSSGIKVSEIKRRDGVTAFELKHRGIELPPNLDSKGITLEKPVKYNLVAVDILDAAAARFILLKESDVPKDIMAALREKRLDPIQQVLLENRNLELDFSEEVACPL
ncbi:MAG: HD domain-containing protein [Magnetococcales bacterium]|nr:HD domain-containing protein [Magnetococcales bacterium]